MNIETIRIGNEEFSSLILLFDLEFNKIKFIPNLHKIIDDYFLEDIKYIYLTNQKELESNGKVLLFENNKN